MLIDALKHLMDIDAYKACPGEITPIHPLKQPSPPQTLPAYTKKTGGPLPLQVTPPLKTDHQEAIQSCKTLAELKKFLEADLPCDLKQGATQLVFGEGNIHAKVMLIGEAPGAEEDKQGRPFVGQSGQLLDKIFASIGLNRTEHLYITNIVPWRPPGNRQPSPEEITLFLPAVKRHIELISPDILVLLGGVPTKALLDMKDGITKVRGRFHTLNFKEGKTVHALATYHPAYLLRSPGQKKWLWDDMCLLKSVLL